MRDNNRNSPLSWLSSQQQGHQNSGSVSFTLAVKMRQLQPTMVVLAHCQPISIMLQAYSLWHWNHNNPTEKSNALSSPYPDLFVCWVSYLIPRDLKMKGVMKEAIRRGFDHGVVSGWKKIVQCNFLCALFITTFFLNTMTFQSRLRIFY